MMHPSPNQDIHPWLPSAFHGRRLDDDAVLYFNSPLSTTCHVLNLSIHDRHIVYEKLKKLEAEVIAERDERMR